MSAPDRSGPDASGRGGRDDERYGSLPERLSTTFEQQADRFEPSNDAYARLAEAANQQAPASPVERFGGWFRPALAAFVVVGIAGVGAIAVQGRNGTPLDTASAGEVASDEADSDGLSDESASSAPTDEVLEAERVDGADPGAADPAADPATDDAEAAPLPVGAAGFAPAARTIEAAAESYLSELGVTAKRFEIDGDRVTAYAAGEDGFGEFEVTRIEVIETGDGFVAVGSDAPAVTIDRVEFIASDGDGRPDELLVAGTGQGFEATLGVRLVSPDDGRVLYDWFVTGGLIDSEPFETVIPIAGSERAWIVITSSGGADVAEPFAARPLNWIGAPDPAGYTVVRVGADDPDGGLVVRDGAGVGSDRLGVIPAGTDGVTREAALPVVVGDDVWWLVSVPEGTTGWVNSIFLARSGDVAADELEALGARLANTLISRNDFDLANLPLSTRLPIVIGSLDGPDTVPAASLRTIDGWTTSRTLSVPESTGPPFSGGLFDYLETERMATNGFVVEPSTPGGAFVYGRNEDLAASYFGDLPSVSIVPDDTETPWVRTIVYVEVTPVGPEIVGIVAEHWEP